VIRPGAASPIPAAADAAAASASAAAFADESLASPPCAEPVPAAAGPPRACIAASRPDDFRPLPPAALASEAAAALTGGASLDAAECSRSRGKLGGLPSPNEAESCGVARLEETLLAGRDSGGPVGDADVPTDSIELRRSSAPPRSAEPTPTTFDRITSCSGAPRAADRRAAEDRDVAVPVRMWAG
jgi:hypothetical protein